MIGMPSCREIATAISVDELEEAPPLRRMTIRLHVMMCHHCRRYLQQMRSISATARELMSTPAGERESVARLKRALFERIERRQP